MSDDAKLYRLVEEGRRGDRAAFHAIYEEFGARIFNFLFRILGSREDAEDVAQQTFLIAFRQLGSLRDPTQLESWIYRIARNEVYQRFRKKKVGSLDDEENDGDVRELEEEGLHAQPEKHLLNEELRQVLQAVLDGLPIKLREVFVLAVVQGMSYQAITKVVGRSLLSVKTDIYRARLQVKEELRKYLGKGYGLTAKAETK
jgi:RNA polymerase sigma-70 factor (ECF subfamily)